MLSYYNPTAKGEPYVSRLLEGFDIETEIPKYQTAWKYTGSEKPIDNTFWSFNHFYNF